MSPVDDQPDIPDPLDLHDNPDPIHDLSKDNSSGLLVIVMAVMTVLAIIAIASLQPAPPPAGEGGTTTESH